MQYAYGELVEWYWQPSTEVLGERKAQILFSPSQIPHILLRDRYGFRGMRSNVGEEVESEQ